MVFVCVECMKVCLGNLTMMLCMGDTLFNGQTADAHINVLWTLDMNRLEYFFDS